MKLRNFYITAKIDGRKTVLKGGPENRGGGFALEIAVAESTPVRPVTIRGFVDDYDQLILEVCCTGDFVHYLSTGTESEKSGTLLQRIYAQLTTKRKTP